MLALTAATAAGQHRPAQTTWQPYPVVPVGTTLPSAAAPPVSTTPPPARLVSPPSQPAVGPIGSRVVVYTKPAGEVRPVQAVGGGQQPGTGAEPPLTPEQRVDRAITAPNPAVVFQMQTDQELFSREVPGLLKDTIKNQIEKLNRDEQEGYRQRLEEYRKDPAGKDPPIPPPTVQDFVVNLEGIPLSNWVVMKPGYVPHRALLEPGYVVHRRLLFEEKNSERYGWELGMAQPFISAAYFYKDVLLWPSHLMSTRERYDTSAGKCLAGSPVPYYLYPPQLTVRGGLWQAAAVIGVVMLVP